MPSRIAYIGSLVAWLVASSASLMCAQDPPAKDELVDPIFAALALPILEKGQAKREVEEFILARVPALDFPETPREFATRVHELRERVLDDVVFRGWPLEWRQHRVVVRNLGARTIETGKGYRIRKLQYEPFPGLWIPALFYEPTNLTGKVPVVLHPNGHDRELGKANVEKQLRCISLAKRGFVCLSTEWFWCGELRSRGYEHNQMALLDLCGRSGLGLFYVALRGGLDVLLSHPNADPSRVAVTGLSGGGWQTIFHAALDERVTVCAPNAGYIGLAARALNRSDVGDLEQNPLDLVSIVDYSHLTAMLIPRSALLIYNERDNCCFASPRARSSVYDPVKPLYSRFAPWAEFSYHENRFPGTHNYGRDNREALYRFLDRQFLPPRRRVDEEVDSSAEVKTDEQLAVGVPADNATFQSLSRGILNELLAARSVQDPISGPARLEERLRLEPTRAKLIDTQELLLGRALRIHLDRGWTIPVREFAPRDRSTTRTVLLFADAGRPSLTEHVKRELNDGNRVLVTDLLFRGECAEGRARPTKYIMMAGTVGRRALGEQVAQILALSRWARDAYGAPIRIDSYGHVSERVAFLSVFFDGMDDSPAIASGSGGAEAHSLRSVVQNDLTYGEAPELFCFGLLEAFESVRDLPGWKSRWIPRPPERRDETDTERK